MPTALAPAPVLGQLDQLDELLDALAEVELSPADVDAAVDLARRVERLNRKVHAVEIGVIAAVEAGGLHQADGHASGQVLVARAARLSETEGKRRDKARRMLGAMPKVRAGLVAGVIGVCQVNRIARVWVNPRVQAEFEQIDTQVAQLAAVLPYDELDRRLTNWVRQVDEDGTADRSRRAEENRRARLVQDFDGGWELLCLVGGVTGARMQEIFRAFVEAEFQADWAEAREIHGSATTVEHLARTFDQRDADAVARIFEFAVAAFEQAHGSAPVSLSIVMDHETFERETRRAAGSAVEPRPVPDLDLLPTDPDPHPFFGDDEAEGVGAVSEPVPASADDQGPASHPGRQFRCETSDGHPLDPTEAFAWALSGRARRMVVDWKGLVTDLSGSHQLFTGPLRDAVVVGHLRCYWTGCPVKVPHCQADHLDPRRNGGRTNPGNGAPCCGRHNRFKENGFTVKRDDRGRIHLYRPDGSEIDY